MKDPIERQAATDEENNVIEFEIIQDMAKYFKLMAEMCLKISEFE